MVSHCFLTDEEVQIWWMHLALTNLYLFPNWRSTLIICAGPKMPNSVSSEVACSLSEKIADTLASEKSGAPLTSVQINFIRNMIEETLDDFR